MASSLFKRYFIAFDKYKWLSLVSFLMVMAASGVVALNTKVSPTYVAKGTLNYNGSPNALSTNNNQIQQQQQIVSKDILLSNQLIKTVAKETQVSAKQIRDNIDVNLPEKTETGDLKSSGITVTYKDTNPQRAKETLLAVMSRIEQQSLEHNIKPMQLIKKKINRELRDTEEIAGNYDLIYNSESIEAEKNDLLKAIAKNQTDQQQIQQQLSSIDTQTRGAPYSRAFIASVFSKDQSIAKLSEQINQTESELAQLESKYLPTHPKIINLQEQLTSDNKRLQSRAAEAVRSLRQQMHGLKQSEKKLQQQYISALNKERARSPLEDQVKRQKDLRDQLLAKHKEVELQETLTISSLDAQDQLFVALEEGFFSRSIPVIIGMGAVIGVLVGGGLIVLLVWLESKFQTWEEIGESLQEKQILGVLPLLKSEADNQTLPVISPNSPYIEFYERCRINLRSFGGTLKVVLLSSTVHFEGKTITAYNLGVVSARAGKKTLIVETDLRSPSQSKSLGVTLPKNVVEPLDYYGNPNSCILPVSAIKNLYILPSPAPMQQTTAVLESNEIQLLMEFARSNFDLVILDTPALGFSNDALLLEPYSDGIVLVTRPQYTEKKLLAEAITQLTDLKLRLLGVIINGVDIPLPYSEVAQYRETPSGMATKNEEVPARTKYL
jgi:capsular exopolysaccharide synthesis family protein